MLRIAHPVVLLPGHLSAQAAHGPGAASGRSPAIADGAAPEPDPGGAGFAPGCQCSLTGQGAVPLPGRSGVPLAARSLRGAPGSGARLGPGAYRDPGRGRSAGQDPALRHAPGRPGPAGHLLRLPDPAPISESVTSICTTLLRPNKTPERTPST